MKLKKLLALACSLVMSASLFASTALVADAAVEGATATLEFAGYETKGTATFAVINVKATIPDTLVPYELVAADWETTFEDTYKGKMIQAVGFDIPNVDGLSYTASLSSCAEYVQLQSNTASNTIQVYAANTGSYDTYYAGEVDVLATLYYRITGDIDATYNLALSNAKFVLVDIDSTTGKATPYTYAFEDFTVTNATVKPEEEEEPTTPVVDTAVAGNDMYGQKTFLTKFETSNNVTDPNVVIAKGSDSKTYGSENFPSGVVGGTMKLIAIVRYAAEAAVAGDVFTITLNDGTTALGSTTYTVPAAE